MVGACHINSDHNQQGARRLSPQEAVFSLVRYGLRRGLIEERDRIFSANLLFDALRLPPSAMPPAPDSDLTSDTEPDPGTELEELLRILLDDAVSRGLIEDGVASRDLFDTRLMGLLTPRPSEVIRRFEEKRERSPEEATDYFYRLAQDSDYIRRYRIRKDKKWTVETAYGTLDITINLSKPEKDPRAIAAALTQAQTSYPKCLLCRENEGYAGRPGHPARQNIRLIPLTLAGEPWFMQYSPYVYYNEHCIVLSEKHAPMKINRATFSRLLEFVSLFPHYTLGSNADLPIVGGSILTHEHYQGGRYSFAMALASLRTEIRFQGYSDISAGILNWPMSVIRLCGADPGRLTELADLILSRWRGYTDEEAGVLAWGESAADAAEKRGEPHNTITPIARRRGQDYELDLVLRNNRTTAEYPLGIFHPHAELHHIKKENIGLIEVMGLAILPSRLLREMELLKDTILKGGDISAVPALAAHAPWAGELLKKYPEYRPEALRLPEGENRSAASAPLRERLSSVIEREIGLVFSKVLEHSAVFPATERGRTHFAAFVDAVNRSQDL